MYDYFKCDVSCPVCGNPVDRFQTKDFEQLHSTYKPGDKVDSRSLKDIRVYTTCDHVREIERFDGQLVFMKIKGVWVEYSIPVLNGRIVQDQNLWVRKTEPVDYNALSCIPDDMTEEEAVEHVRKSNDRRAQDIKIIEIEKKHHEDGYIGRA